MWRDGTKGTEMLLFYILVSMAFYFCLKVNIAQQDLLLFPLNDKGNHWTLLVRTVGSFSLFMPCPNSCQSECKIGIP